MPLIELSSLRSQQTPLILMSYIKLDLHLNKYGHPYYFPLLQRGIEEFGD